MQLPGRARVARREARAVDEAEIIPEHGIRLPKVGLIENIECVGPDLQVQALRNLGVLDHREVQVGEAGSDHDVTTQITEGVARIY